MSRFFGTIRRSRCGILSIGDFRSSLQHGCAGKLACESIGNLRLAAIDSTAGGKAGVSVFLISNGKVEKSKILWLAGRRRSQNLLSLLSVGRWISFC
ncbi:hypothetical protein [Microcoleus sp. bin38.metabat.b11b12b14.051]|uniref:hypothetical protein n=1 Tax=Microcoleus sp. bin38.metabat.b11b12b14.051 TaxID=2742709 RepID=UPI0025CE7B33|nr:hypothetical protein [Microcoleus sp. bin38.metabat.b11b12b14.051]